MAACHCLGPRLVAGTAQQWLWRGQVDPEIDEQPSRSLAQAWAAGVVVVVVVVVVASMLRFAEKVVSMLAGQLLDQRRAHGLRLVLARQPCSRADGG